MLMPVFALLQSAGGTDARETASDPLHISADRCGQNGATENEVVVCARRGEGSPYRIGPQIAQPPALPDAEFKLIEGVGVKVHAEKGELGGIPTNRGLISLKIRF